MSAGRKAKWTCACGRRATQIHYRTYERLGKERPSDLHAVCDPCHIEIHRLERAGMSLADATDAILATIGNSPRLGRAALRRLARP